VHVAIRLLGTFEVAIDRRSIVAAGFARRDAVLLVKLLALNPAVRMHREQVIEALWPDVPFPVVGNRLHKAAHFVRKATDTTDSIVLDDRVVALFPNASVTIDVANFETTAAAALRTGDHSMAQRAADLYGGELLPDDPYESWAFNIRQRLALRHRELLRLLGRYDEIVAVDPTDEGAHIAIMQRQLDRGDSAGAADQFDLMRRVLEDELGLGPSEEAIELRDRALVSTPISVAAGEPAPRFAALATQVVHRCSTSDGVRIAYATSGAGPPLVKASTWLTHLDYDWHSPVWRHWWEALSRRHTLVRYDERGSGLSDWEVDESSYTLDAWVHDLETVVDARGLERFPLLGISQGGPIAITYAARHPERVSHVVVYGTCARATWAHASEQRRRELDALGELIRVSWGSDQPGFRQVYDAKFLPDGPLETWRAFDELQRRSTSARNAYLLWRAFGSLDCSDAAHRLDVPTLILHANDDQVWSFEEAEALQAMVAGSRLVPLHSRNHILQADEGAFATFVDELERFLADS
jgi:DNA-binding SARP family transcriptional activator/pimeloyl-ACP methyl ester carboxylesterase